jgi:hypothetical protein
MGTGKTKLMEEWRVLHPDDRFLNNGHRVSLLNNLASRLNTEIYSDLAHGDWEKANALSITIDSLYKLNTHLLSYGCIFIDEACQYLTHLLHSETCKLHRAQILEVLEYLVFQAPLVVIADAHMDDITIDFFRAMRPEGEVPFIIKNEWKNPEREVYWYEGKDPSALVAQISAALMVGQKIMVVSDSKRFIKKLETMLAVQFECKDSDQEDALQERHGDAESFVLSSECLDLSVSPCPLQSTADPKQQIRVWSVTSENSSSKRNVALIKDISNAVKNFDALLASPSLGTGVDISDYHFDMIFGAFHAVSQTATECVQMLYRYRPNVPINVWVAPKSTSLSHAEFNPENIKRSLLQTNDLTAFLIRIDRNTGCRGAEKDWALDAHCNILARRNHSINNLRADLRSLLEEMGNKIILMGANKDKETKKQLQEAAKVMDLTHVQAVTKAKEITESEYRRRQSQKYLEPDEMFECEKFRIAETYGMPITEELVRRDDKGKLIRLITNLEAILAPSDGIVTDEKTGKEYPAPPAVVVERDLMERELLSMSMDWGNYSASWLARYILGLHNILSNWDREFRATDDDLIEMTKTAHKFAPCIKVILGFTVPPKCTPVWLLSQFLEQLGLKLTSRKEGPRGKQVAVHTLARAEKEFALSVIAYRQSLRLQKKQKEEEQRLARMRRKAAMSVIYGSDPHHDFVDDPPTNSFSKQLEEGKDTKENHKKQPDQQPKAPPKLTKEEAKTNIKRAQLRKAITKMAEQSFPFESE